MEISMDEIVVSDIVYLSAGDMIPADLHLPDSGGKESVCKASPALTGESEPLEKLGV